MRRPPAVVRIAVPREDGKPFRLWLPLFLLWPLVLVPVLIAIPIWFVAGLAYLVLRHDKRVMAVPVRAADLVCSLPGLLIVVRSQGKKSVDIGVW